MAIPQDWMPPGMPDAQKDEIAAKHPDDPAAAAAEAWAVWANEMPVEDQGVTRVQTGAQSVTYDQSPYDSAMERARWYASRSKSASAVDVGGAYKFGWLSPYRWSGASEAGDGDPALGNGEPWGSHTVSTSDVLLENGTGPLNARSNFVTQEDANKEIAAQIASKADQDHVHADGGTVDLTDYETKAEAAVAHNSLDQNITVGLAGKADKDHDHTIDLDGYVTKDEANEAHQALDRKIDAAAAGDHKHDDYETKGEAKAAHDSLSGRITQVSQDKADTGHGHIDLETKVSAQESHQDLQDQIDDRALASHTHAEYANPDLSAYETKVASESRDQGLENQIKGKADAGHTHPEMQPPDLSGLVTDGEFAEDQRRQDLALTEGLAEKSQHNHVHDGADGGPKYELEKDAVQRYERTALELSTKADKDHDHGATDHQHDDLATSKDLQTETALRKQGDADLQSQINSAVAGGHSHTEYADKAHAHGDYSKSDHTHPEYEGGGGGASDVNKAYVDARDADEAAARSAGDDALQAQIDSIQHTPPYDDQQIKDDLAQEVKDREAGDDHLQAQIEAVDEKVDNLPEAPGLDLTQQDGEAMSLENLTTIGTLRYDRGSFTWGADARNNYARFNHDAPTVVGLNQYPLEGGTILWREVFPVGDTLIIEGAAGSMALRVLDTQISGTNDRTHNFKTEVLYRTGEFVGEEVLTISTGDVATQKQLLLDGAVVGDSTYESRITALESAPAPDLDHDHDESYVKTDGDTNFPHEADRRWTKWKSNSAKNADGTNDLAQAFGLSIDLTEGNTYKNQFEVTANGGYIFKALGGTGREMWVGGALRQKSGDLDNPNPEDYVTRTNLTDATEPLLVAGEFPEDGFPDGPLTGYEIFDFADKMFDLIDFNQKLQDRKIAENKAAVAELTARMDALEEVMKPWLGIDIGTYATKSSGNYEPTGTSQDEGTASMWWTNVSMNTTPNNHVRIGMQGNPDLCKQIAAYPVPFEMDVIQPTAKQTWHVYEVYERGDGVLHVLNDVAWGDPMTHSHIAVDTQYVVRKV